MSPSADSSGSAAATRPPLSSTRRLALGFAILSAITYSLVVLGALVRANHAGLACPDWPLCFGQVIPELDVRVGFEFGHRVLAGFVSLGFLAGAVGVLRDPVARTAVGRWVLVAAVLLAVQVVLGGLTVLEMLASWTVTSHLVAGNAFALCVALIARQLFDTANDTSDPSGSSAPREASGFSKPLQAMISFTAILLVGQIVLGGLVSSTYSGLVCPDWPSCYKGAFIPSWTGPQGLQVLHRLNAYALATCLLACFVSSRRLGAQRRLQHVLGLALIVVLAQVAVGVANVLLRLPVEVTGLHSALAAGLCLLMGLAVLDSWKPPASPHRALP